MDGRSARAGRTRAAIVDAHIELLRAGNLRPTGEHIAARAGISVRSIWSHFPELEALFEATAAAVLDRQDRAFRPVDPGLALSARIDAFCGQRGRMLEQVAPFARASVLREPYSPALRDYHRRHVQRVIDEISLLFRGELAGLPADECPAVTSALAAAATWGSWSTLRDDLGLSAAESRAVMARTVRALLAQGYPDGPAEPADPRPDTSPAVSPQRRPATHAPPQQPPPSRTHPRTVPSPTESEAP